MEKPDEPSENILFLVSASLRISVPAQWEGWSLELKGPFQCQPFLDSIILSP